MRFVEHLFRALVDPIFDNKWPTLLKLINRLLRDNPSLTSSVSEQIVLWCMNRLSNPNVIELLQVC